MAQSVIFNIHCVAGAFHGSNDIWMGLDAYKILIILHG